MKHGLVILAVFAGLLTQAFSNSMTTGVGNSNNTSTYSGPGNVVSGALAWYGLRAYNSAGRGGALVNVCNSTGGVDVGCADMLSSASTGALVPATINGIPCPGTNCTVKTFYDLSGNSHPVTQATVANRGTLTASCLGSLPCATVNSAASQCYVDTSGITQAQPYMAVWVANTSSAVGTKTILSDSNDVTEVGFFNLNTYEANTAVVSSTPAVTQNVFSVVQDLFNGATSNITVDGTTSANISPGVTGLNGGQPVLFAFGSGGASPTCGGQFFLGQFVEGGWFPGPFSGANLTAMNSNIHTFWGF